MGPPRSEKLRSLAISSGLNGVLGATMTSSAVSLGTSWLSRLSSTTSAPIAPSLVFQNAMLPGRR